MSKYIPDEDRDEIFKRLKMERANQFCAECGTPHPQWASATLGIFICYQCSGLHRSFGVHLSFVRSLNMDSWTPKQIYIMEHGGNQRFLDYSKSKGIPQGSPSSMKYQSRAFDDYRKMLSSEADSYLGTGSSSSQQQRTPRSGGGQQSVPRRSTPQPAQAAPSQPPKKKEDPLDSWDGWGDMEASLAAIEKKQRSAGATTPRSGAPRGTSPQRTPPPSSSPTNAPLQPQTQPQPRKQPQATTTTTATKSSSSMDSLDGWSGWGDTESSLAEIERKQQQSQQHNQKNIAMYGARSTTPTGTGGKRYESLSSEDYFAQQGGGAGSSSSSSQPQRTFQAYGRSSSSSSSYQQGASPAIADAFSSGWSKISSFAKSVAQQTTKAVHDSGLYDAVQGFINGPNSSAPQRSSLLGDQSESSTTPRQYSSSYQPSQQQQQQQQQHTSYSAGPSKTSSSSSVSSSSTAHTTTAAATTTKPQPQFVGPTAASQGLKPATGADDEFNELVHGGMSKSRGAKAAQPGDGPLLDDMPDVDAWLDSTLAMEAAKQANNAANTDSTSTTTPSASPAPSTAAAAASTETKVAETKTESKDGDSSELGDDWDTW